MKLFRSMAGRLIKRILLAVRRSPYETLHIPDIAIQQDLDFLLIELPPRYVPMMPNGLGYVHKILVKAGIRFQTVDANVVIYHQFHAKKRRERRAVEIQLSGNKEDPWDNTNSNDWHREDVIAHFWPYLTDLLSQIAVQSPRAVGISLNGNNRGIAKRFVQELRKRAPDTAIVVGGYDCVYHSVGPHLFRNFDYMVIGEAEETLVHLVTALARGERPRDVTGIVSRYDSPDRQWQDPPIPQDLDALGFPQYEWTDVSLYRDHSGSHLVPITASRGCRWGRCRFCAECLPFRRRSPGQVADEIRFMVDKGFHCFHFNESDVNGDPEALYDLCSEIIRRGLPVKLMGQLRIDKRSTAEYFKHLGKAGFKHLRFGVDGWSDKVLRLQRKGYQMGVVFQNLRECHATGIYTAVNIVIGVPGETEQDVDECIQNMILARNDIDCVESFNTLILASGSEYYGNADEYKIRFRGDKNLIYKKNPYYIPPDLWYSVDPYIDQEVRLQRLDRICAAVYEKGINIGAFAERAIRILKEGT